MIAMWKADTFDNIKVVKAGAEVVTPEQLKQIMEEIKRSKDAGECET